MSLKFPTIYLLPTHIEREKLPEVESTIPTLTYDINEAEIILGRISNGERAKFELRRRKVITEEIQPEPITLHSSETETGNQSPSPKWRKLSLVSPKTTHNARFLSISDVDGNPENLRRTTEEADGSIVKVVKLSWFTDCLARGSVLPLENYLVYQGRKMQQVASNPPPDIDDVLKRARKEVQGRATGSSSQHCRTLARAKRPALAYRSTSEDERRSQMPPVPDYLHKPYSCQRPTPFDPPNDSFVEELKKVRTLRTLEGDQTGIRAYSTAIASLAAYPYLISHPDEVERLPGCSEKIATLYCQWKANGSLEEVENAKADPKMSVLQLFYGIWGVAGTTAREFFEKGWRDLDDIIEYGWDSLTRDQQIGVKYYDELQEKIPRREVEDIGHIILTHANKLGKGFQMVIVGGYRRGKKESGDVDILLSHPDSSVTSNFVVDIVSSLERDKYITHTLTMSTKNSERGQTPVSWKGERNATAGFDTLDKTMVVWQDPNWDETASPKNPNPHRRVDIIITPWKTAGCAVIGWTGGTTFERDLRRYCKYKKAMKFDSSGVRNRTNGSWVDLESDANGPAPNMLTAEKRVFERLDLEWRPPEERCTG